MDKKYITVKNFLLLSTKECLLEPMTVRVLTLSTRLRAKALEPYYVEILFSLSNKPGKSLANILGDMEPTSSTTCLYQVAFCTH